MNPRQLETITKAAQCADLLTSDIREAHKLACRENPVLEILLRELLGDAVKLDSRLAQLDAGLQEQSSELRKEDPAEPVARLNTLQE
jgi:hypothetical protein